MEKKSPEECQKRGEKREKEKEDALWLGEDGKLRKPLPIFIGNRIIKKKGGRVPIKSVKSVTEYEIYDFYANRSSLLRQSINRSRKPYAAH